MNKKSIRNVDEMSIGGQSVLFVISAIGIIVCSFVLVAMFYFLVFNAFTRDLPHVTFLIASWGLSFAFLVTLWLNFARFARRLRRAGGSVLAFHHSTMLFVIYS